MQELMASIRDILSTNATIVADENALGVEDDLFDRGLTSFQSVQVMMAIEQRFDVEFPDALIRKETFQTVGRIASAVGTLLAKE